MAKSEVAIFTPDDLNVVATERALHAYKFAYQYAGIELDEETEVDFIATRNLLSGWKELDELRIFFEKAAKSIKAVLKHTWNVGSIDDLPDTKELKVSWEKQKYTYEWQVDGCPLNLVNELVEKGLISVETLLSTMSVSQLCKAVGMEQEKMMELYPQYICAKKSERNLRIK